MIKSGLHSVSRALALEYAKDGIRVSTVAAGIIDTPMPKPETHDFLKTLHPSGRIAIRAVAYRASVLFDTTQMRASSAVNYQSIS